jgi:hypothetical protein
MMSGSGHQLIYLLHHMSMARLVGFDLSGAFYQLLKVFQRVKSVEGLSLCSEISDQLLEPGPARIETCPEVCHVKPVVR